MAERDQYNQMGRGDEGSNDDSYQKRNVSETSENNPEDNGKSDTTPRSSNRGFAAMDPEKQKEIASEGGRAAHRQGVAHEWSSDEAREAGRKGGQIVSRNREHMSAIGRRGGQSSGSRRSQRSNNTPNNTEEKG